MRYKVAQFRDKQEKQMKWDDLSTEQCSVARSSLVLGDRWTLVILSDCFLGVRRFDEFQERLNISRTTLAKRLKLLEEHGVLEQRAYQNNPPRYEYRLTEKGKDLYPVIATVVTWGDKYYSDAGGPPILRRHMTCGHDGHPVLHCSECAQPLDARDVQARKRPKSYTYSDVRRGPVERKRA
tara:strand:- start:237 stop:779 length:543 start_codon:yes stop_codon:yes gene_type:complete